MGKNRYRNDKKVLFHKNKLFQHQISKEFGINKPSVIQKAIKTFGNV